MSTGHDSEGQLDLFEGGAEHTWSYSRLKSLRRCPLEYKVRWLSDQHSLFEPGHIDVQAGRLLHHIIREYYRSPANAEPYQLLLKAYHKLAPHASEWKDDLQGENRALAALQLFAYSKAATLRAAALEVACKARISETSFVGQADLIYEIPGSPTAYGILEFKLNDVEVRVDDPAERFLQCLIYYAGLPAQFRSSTKAMGIYIFDTGMLLEAEIDRALLNKAFSIVETALQSANGPEFPARINPFCKSCGYQTLCPAYSSSLKRR
ncbi:MAG: PD-(D/E)XK nuclease family protein [Acidobacteriia bacterium]|nr:PD-(D/E)XK nuclease family protein [Terriglobia bacterium]MBZ5652699.1 PD-(D/E)XK nuclease family protein [Terriglobia bacterium]MBZ5658549.1 PD-(D/E)XK nuclease family protein [Terriglobia bacterium]